MQLTTSADRVESGADVVTRLDILSEAECERVYGDVFALRDLWTHRHETRPFFTLGTPSYMDATRGRFDSYREGVARLNPILEERFGWLYAKLLPALERAGYSPAIDDARLSHPGFHIYIGDGGDRPTPPSIHYDLQYEHIDWSPHGHVDLSTPLSFTLTLRLPSAGGGLHVWDVDVHAARQMPEPARKAYLFNKRQSTYHPYRLGEMVLHNGHYLHQIARLSELGVGDARITLQGHAVSTNSGWVVYW
ncbi:MAG TPA: hypothetical protein VGY57_03350 [Vicinamibacterales bacterium]|jgi:hypothetical protein|nr:hypothetical protein [Vicinamibacterales bacterium]